MRKDILSLDVTVYVHSNWKHLNHFGNHERNYSHWLENVPPPGIYPVWRVMLDNPDMANPQKRDASALRLLSWLSFSLGSHTSALGEAHETACYRRGEQPCHPPYRARIEDWCHVGQPRRNTCRPYGSNHCEQPCPDQ